MASNEMKEIPVLFQPDMVRAVLRDDDQKTQTRRTKALEYFSENDPDNWRCVRIHGDIAYFVYKNSPMERKVKCPYGQAGDRIWGREAWRAPSGIFDDIKPRDLSRGTPIRYEADGAHLGGTFNPGKLRPSMFMMRWMSRITLEVINIRVERLQDISEVDAKAEGCSPLIWDGKDGPADLIDWPLKSVDRPYANDYALLWESINGAGSWDANPFVWVISFNRVNA